MELETLNAVHDDDLKDVLEELGIYRSFVRHELKCHFCGDTVSWDNLYSIFPLSGSVKVSCSKPECVEKLVYFMEGRRSA